MNDAATTMNNIAKIAFATCCTFLLAAQASAEGGAAGAGPGVLQRVESAVTRGAKAAGNGIERGAKAAGNGIEHGAKAAAKGADVGVKAAGRGLERGAKATQNAAGVAADKVGKHVGPSSSGK